MNDTIRYVGKDVGEAAWSTEAVLTGATDKNDGRVNMAIIKKISGWKGLYPAFALCDALNTGNVTGWYLPTRKELYDIHIDNDYWSSTEYYENQAYTYRNLYPKGSICKVKAVHRF